MHLEQYDRIRDRIAAEGWTPAIETQIALFICAAKAVNLPFLALAGAAVPPVFAWPGFGGGTQDAGPGGVVWQYLNAQLFRESEALTLLCRITRWSPDPWVYARSMTIVAPISAEAARVGLSGLQRDGQTPGLETLAFGHALLAQVRLAPIIPPSEAQAPFAVALTRIEQENGRLLQTQIRLLKDGYAETPLAEREAVIAAKVALVEAAFERFLDSLAD